MTTAEQDIEMYMRVYAAAVTGLLSSGETKDNDDLNEKADQIADDAVKVLRERGLSVFREAGD